MLDVCCCELHHVVRSHVVQAAVLLVARLVGGGEVDTSSRWSSSVGPAVVIGRMGTAAILRGTAAGVAVAAQPLASGWWSRYEPLHRQRLGSTVVALKVVARKRSVGAMAWQVLLLK
jgi:hypothetical protein